MREAELQNNGLMCMLIKTVGDWAVIVGHKKMVAILQI